MNRSLVLLPTLLAAAAASALASAIPDAPSWPLPLETRYLTSNFMEHRSGRFHAGLDLKTEGRTGFPVLAAEDGWIARIRVSPAGYGKTLYLRGASGRTYVYAHLERIGDRWRSEVRRAQARRGRYDVTLHFPAGKHEVSRGEILALSGQSGAAGPHLHFEVRDAENRPLDPQAHGFSVPDTLPPTILKIRAMPASPLSRVEGGLAARSVSGDPLSGELPRLRIRGRVAFSAQILETSDIMGFRLEPYRLAVSLDDSLVFESRNDGYDFALQHLMRLEWLEQPGWHERWLMRREGDVLPGRRGEGWSLDPAVLTPGEHVVRVTAADRAGNDSEVFWTLLVSPEEPGDPPASAASWREDPVRVEVPWDGEGPRRWLTPFLEANGEVVKPAEIGDGGLLDGGPSALAPDSLTALERLAAGRVQGLEALGWSARVVAPDWSARAGVAFPLAAALPDILPPELGVYMQDRGEDWNPAGVPRRLGAAWVFDAHEAGRYALFLDRNAPYLGPGPDEGLVRRVAPSRVAAVSAPTWEVFAIRTEDLGSGIDTESIRVSLDGRPLIAEPDPPRDRLLVELPDATPPGAHRLEITVSDRAGHVTARTYQLVLIATP
ncbi:M23 family metallopeptidase [bacterium]|nr:M23 family metallopeptidase [bacterium]MBU1676858.1 M23 family metallopeptidase [bacterium]